MNLNEVGAEKVRAILTRQKARDVHDLYYLLEKKKIVFDGKLVDKKLAYLGKSFSKEDMMTSSGRKTGVLL